MRFSKLAILAVLAILGLASGCSRDSWDITNPGNQEETNAEFSITLSSPMALDGEEVYISGSVVPGYLQDPNIMVLFGTFQGGEVVGTFDRQVWGNEKFSVDFWRKDSDNRYHRMLDISVNGVELYALQASEFEIYREFQLYVEDGQLMIDPMTDVNDLVEVQVWYTGNSLPEDYMNNPADPDVPVFWMGTWTTFRFAPHTTYWENGMWTAKFYVARGAVTYLRLQLADGTELRSGVYVGLPGDFEHATELMNLVDLGGGWTVFAFMRNMLDEIVNLWPEDDRLYGIEIGG